MPIRVRARVAAASAAVLAIGSLAGCASFDPAGDAAAAAAVTPDCTKAKCVALTFDDGPGVATARLLDILAEKKVHATFFMLGKQVKLHPEIAARAANEGHELGDHTWDHKRLTSLPQDKIVSQINRTSQQIFDATGVRPDVARPPDGAINSDVADIIGLPAILWTIDTMDWQHRDTEKTVDAVRDVQPGSVILMHDIYKSTVDGVARVIDRLKSDGFELVTVRDLFGDRLHPGGIYRSNLKAYEKAQAAEDKAEAAREIDEYLKNSGQPETGAAPGPVVPRTALPPSEVGGLAG